MSKDRNRLELLIEKGYIISRDGVVSNPKGNIINGGIHANGYRKFNTRIDGTHNRVYFHRFQAFQKFGESLFEEGIVVRHLNGDPLDNSFDNIEIGTQSDNMMDMPLSARLEKSKLGAIKWIKYDKEEVNSYYDSVKSYKKTMEKFGISSKGTLHAILNTRVY